MEEEVNDDVIELAVKKLEVESGSILAVKFDNSAPHDARRQILDELALRLRDSGLEGVLILALDNGIDIEALDETVMRKFGWIKSNGARGLLH